MKEMIYERQNSGNLERDDLFSKMIEANNSDDVKLDEDEVMGNIYIFLIAGHEVCMHAWSSLYQLSDRNKFCDVDNCA